MAEQAYAAYQQSANGYIGMVTGASPAIGEKVIEYFTRAASATAGVPTIWVFALGLMNASDYESWNAQWSSVVVEVGKVVYAYLAFRRAAGIKKSEYLGAENLGAYFPTIAWPPPPYSISYAESADQSMADDTFRLVVLHDAEEAARMAAQQADDEEAERLAAIEDVNRLRLIAAAEEAEALRAREAAEAAAEHVMAPSGAPIMGAVLGVGVGTGVSTDVPDEGSAELLAEIQANNALSQEERDAIRDARLAKEAADLEAMADLFG